MIILWIFSCLGLLSFLINQILNKKINNLFANLQNPHREGYGFGLGVAVRTEPGLAAVPGNVGEYSWNGAYGTGYFADPQAKLVVVFGTAAPGDLRKYYREQIQNLVYQNPSKINEFHIFRLFPLRIGGIGRKAFSI